MNDNRILVGGAGNDQVHLDVAMANRHGLVAGATGTGKTVTLQVLAEGFSQLGVPVFLADVKGDLSGLARPANPHPKIDERVQKIGITDFQFAAAPTVFWDLFGTQGHPIRATISDLGPLLPVASSPSTPRKPNATAPSEPATTSLSNTPKCTATASLCGRRTCTSIQIKNRKRRSPAAPIPNHRVS